MKQRLKVLFLSRWFPYPIDNGSKIRIYNLLEHLSSRHEVDLISFASEPVQSAALQVMQESCRRVEYVLYKPFQPRALKATLGYFSFEPRSVRDTYNAEMAEWVKRASTQRDYDAVIASQIDMAPYAELVGSGVKILEEIELTSLYEQQHRSQGAVERARRSFMWWKWSNYTTRMLRGFDGATVVSELEQKRVLAAAPPNLPVRVIPNGVAVAAMQGDFAAPQPGTLVFSGSLTYGPNLEAMEYFLKEIFPRVQQRYPAARLLITGKQDPDCTARLPESSNVIFTGYLDDVRPVVAESWAAVVPLRTGGGTRLKVLEAQALGTPVVSTYKGVEGLEMVPGRDFLLGKDPAGFADAVLNLLNNPGLRREISRAGRKITAEKYDWAKIGPCFCDFIEEISAKKRNR
jgi:polysaccharide biosynthesis protein PslH